MDQLGHCCVGSLTTLSWQLFLDLKVTPVAPLLSQYIYVGSSLFALTSMATDDIAQRLLNSRQDGEGWTAKSCPERQSSLKKTPMIFPN